MIGIQLELSNVLLSGAFEHNIQKVCVGPQPNYLKDPKIKIRILNYFMCLKLEHTRERFTAFLYNLVGDDVHLEQYCNFGK